MQESTKERIADLIFNIEKYTPVPNKVEKFDIEGEKESYEFLLEDPKEGEFFNVEFKLSHWEEGRYRQTSFLKTGGHENTRNAVVKAIIRSFEKGL